MVGSTDGGSSTPNSAGSDPAGSTVPSDWVITEDPINDLDTKASQHGWAPANSPTFTQRLNIFPGDGNFLNYQVTGSRIKSKPEGYRTLKLRIYARVSDEITAGKKIEINLIVGQWGADGSPPTSFYKLAVKFDNTTDETKWAEYERVFRGWNPAATLFTYITERRNDITDNDTDVEVWIARTSAIWEP